MLIANKGRVTREWIHTYCINSFTQWRSALIPSKNNPNNAHTSPELTFMVEGATVDINLWQALANVLIIIMMVGWKCLSCDKKRLGVWLSLTVTMPTFSKTLAQGHLVVLRVLDLDIVALQCHHPGGDATIWHASLSEALAVHEGDWLVTSLDDYLLAADVAAKVFHGPNCGKEGFLAVWEHYLHAAHGSTSISDNSLVRVIFLCDCSTQTVSRKACLRMKLLILVWVGQTRCWAELLFHKTKGSFLESSPFERLVLSSVKGLAISA